MGDFVPVLSNLEMVIKKGKLVGIIGNIGSGKTSLINSLFGETITDKESKPQIQILDSIALVNQLP